MISRINKILNSQQLEAVLRTLFPDRPVKILRIIAATGRSQVCWVHLENTISGRRIATFLPFKDLIVSFWQWLAVLEVFALATWEINNIATCVWNLVNVGDRVFSRHTNQLGTIVDKLGTIVDKNITTSQENR
ncbi:MAG: hypothetical protein Tsb0014_45590 [Pleurocapsa sp.]